MFCSLKVQVNDGGGYNILLISQELQSGLVSLVFLVRQAEDDPKVSNAISLIMIMNKLNPKTK